MPPATFAAAIDRDGRRILAAVDDALGAPVATCPGWAIRDVLGHLGRVHRSVAEVLETRTMEPPTAAVPSPPDGDEVVAFFEAGLERLLAALTETAADTPVYTWAGDGTAAFYHRRMAHEIAVHRYDVQSAQLRHVGRPVEPDPFDPELATDAIDELYGVVLPFALRRRRLELPAATLHVHRTDGAGEWLVRGVDDRIEVTREHAKGDVALRGPASDLLVFLWNRGRPPSVDVFGDAQAATAWAELAP